MPSVEVGASSGSRAPSCSTGSGRSHLRPRRDSMSAPGLSQNTDLTDQRRAPLRLGRHTHAPATPGEKWVRALPQELLTFPVKAVTSCVALAMTPLLGKSRLSHAAVGKPTAQTQNFPAVGAPRRPDRNWRARGGACCLGPDRKGCRSPRGFGRSLACAFAFLFT